MTRHIFGQDDQICRAEPSMIPNKQESSGHVMSQHVCCFVQESVVGLDSQTKVRFNLPVADN